MDALRDRFILIIFNRQITGRESESRTLLKTSNIFARTRPGKTRHVTEYDKTAEYPDDIPQILKESACYDNYLKDKKRNCLH